MALLADIFLTLGYVAAVCVGLVFVVAGVSKLRHRDLLPGVIANYRLLPEAAVAPAALLLPIAELLVGAALIAGESLFAPLSAIALLLIFAAAMAVNLRRGRSHIDCGCGRSHLRQPLSWALVVRNVALAAALLPRLALGGWPALPQLAIALAAGASIFLFYLLFNTLRTLSAVGSHHGHSQHAHR